MSATELLKEVKALPVRERQKFLESIHQMEEILEAEAPNKRMKKISWPDAAARRRKIFGNNVLPNLVSWPHS